VSIKLQEVSSLRLRRGLISIVVAAAIFQPACLVRKRTTVPPGVPVNRPLLRASKEELIKRIQQFSDPIESFNMKVDMSPTVGNLQGGTVTDYTSIIGYVLFRKPDQIRVIGLEPAIHGTAFDMVSIGNDFRVSIPYRNEFIEGRNDAPASSQSKLENLRPAAFLTALLIKPPQQTTATILEDDTDETRATYILMVIERDGDQLKLVRNVYFDRYTLDISRQKTFDPDGSIASDTRYSNWKDFGGTRFPVTIDIERPKDGYEVVLNVIELKMNTPDVTAEKFVLNPPPNAKVRALK
jgi:outer membrane lipoprotein-sorting protein